MGKDGVVCWVIQSPDGSVSQRDNRLRAFTSREAAVSWMDVNRDRYHTAFDGSEIMEARLVVCEVAGQSGHAPQDNGETNQ